MFSGLKGKTGSMRLMADASLDWGATLLRPPVAVSSSYSGMASSDFAATAVDEATLLALWSDSNGDVQFRRSLDQAATFQPALTLGNSGSDPGYPYLIYAGGSDVYAAWSRYSFSFRHSADSGASWSSSVASDSPPCYWNSTFLPTASGQLFLSCMADESYTSPSSSSLYFNSAARGAGWQGAGRINSNVYQETGSVYGVPDIDASLIDSSNGNVVLAWEDARNKATGDAKGYDIYWSVSNDYGVTWSAQNTRLPSSFPYGGATLWGLVIGGDHQAYTFWKEGTAMYVDIRPVAGQTAMTAMAATKALVGAASRRKGRGLRIAPARSRMQANRPALAPQH